MLIARPRKNVVSISGGKDSAVTAVVCRETEGVENMEMVSAETDNEHQITYDYLNYLEDYFGMPIRRLRADFAARIEWDPLESTCRHASLSIL